MNDSLHQNSTAFHYSGNATSHPLHSNVITDSLHPPRGYGVVEEGVYRCHTLRSEHLPFLFQRRLKTILLLSNVELLGPVRRAIDTHVARGSPGAGPVVVRLGARHWFPSTDLSLRVARCIFEDVPDDLIKEALEIILDVSNHPILLGCDASSLIGVCVVVGCLRRLQFGCLHSIYAELTAYSEGVEATVLDSVLERIAQFDCTLVNLPRLKDTVPWWWDQLKATESEEMTMREGVPAPRGWMLASEVELSEGIPAFLSYMSCLHPPALSLRSAYDPQESLVMEDAD